MAKRICPFCKEKVKKNATICKHCKSELPPLPPKKWYQTWKGLLLILFALGIFAGLFEEQPNFIPTSSPSPSSTTIEKRILKNSINEWVEYYPGGYFYDKKNIQKILDPRRLSVFTVRTLIQKEGGQAGIYTRITCPTKEISYGKINFYDNDAKLISTQDSSWSEWGTPKGIQDKALVEAVCKFLAP